MPELPEVETIVRACRPRLEGRIIRAFKSTWPKNVTPSLPRVRRALVGRTIERLDRRAKFIVFHLTGGGCLLIHLRMTGRLEWAADHDDRPPHVRAFWDLDDGSRLLFRDARKFGRIAYAPDFADATADLGPEPLAPDFTARTFGEVLRGRRRQLKPLLLDQSMVAGLGNIYTDEALFRAGLHPTTHAGELTKGQVARLRTAIRQVLRQAIRHGGTSFDWAYEGGRMQKMLKVYGRAGEPCQRCAAPIVALRVGQRGIHICPRCQPG